MTPLFAALLVGVSLLFIGGIVLAIYQRLYGVPPPLGPRWAELAARLGLALEPHEPEQRRSLFGPPPSRDRAMAGTLDGWRVRVIVVDQPAEPRQMVAMRIEVGLPHSLGLGLHLYAARGPGVERRYTVRSRYVVTAIPSIDDNFVSFGDDRAQIGQLVQTPVLLDGLLAALQARVGVMLEDDRVQVGLDGHHYEPETIAGCIATATDLARRLMRARAELGSPTP